MKYGLHPSGLEQCVTGQKVLSDSR